MNALLAPGPVQQWYRDSCSCLQTTIASLALHERVDPLAILGRSVNLRPESEVRHVEYYAPGSQTGNYVEWICPETTVSAQWHACESVDGLAALVEDRPIILPVDNYYLPFRPAHQDVHAAHLLLVTAVRQTANEREFYVSDAQPPAFQGWLPARTLVEAWYSPNPTDLQDAFFSGASSAGQVLLPSGVPNSELSGKDLLSHAAAGGRRLLGSGEGSIAAARSFWTTVGETDLQDLYIMGWWHQAQAHLHAELVASTGRVSPELASRLSANAYAVANAWSPVRIAAARGYGHLPEALAALLSSYEQYAYEALTVSEEDHG